MQEPVARCVNTKICEAITAKKKVKVGGKRLTNGYEYAVLRFYFQIYHLQTWIC